MSTNVAPLISPLERDWPILWQFADRLQELGYTEQNVSKAMGLTDHSLRDFRAWPAHLRHCRKQMRSDHCALLAAFFLVEEAVEVQRLQALLGFDVVKVMRMLKWVGELDEGKLYFRYLLYPLLGAFILTDGPISNPSSLNQVYPLGSDSHLLARLAPRPEVATSLDHCTGSGVHAVLAGRHCQRGFGLDINPRALQFARFNAMWNQQQNVKFLESDCYQNVRPEILQLPGCAAPPECRFDLITANPPFVPTPETLSLCRGGGISGEEVTEKIVRGLPDMLSQSGIFSMITNVPVFANQTFFERCERWLDSSESWGVVVLSNHKWTPASYTLAHQSPVSFENYGSHFQLWLDAYESVQLEAVTNSQVYIFRSPHAWRIERNFVYAYDCASPFIESWIASLRAFQTDPASHYRLHPGLEKIWWLEGRTRVYLQWKQDYQWWQPQGVWLEGPAAQAVQDLEQRPGDRCDPLALSPLLSAHLVTLV